MPDTLIPNIVSFIRNVDPFDKLPLGMLEQIAAKVQIQYFVRNESIPISQESSEAYLYVIYSGALEQRFEDGSLRAKLGASDIFGFSLLAYKQGKCEQPYTIKSIDDVLLYSIPMSHLLTVLASDPIYFSHFSQSAQDRLHKAINVVWSENEKGMFFDNVLSLATKNTVIVSTDLSIREVAQKMHSNDGSSCAFVIEYGSDDNTRFVGLITDKDMTKRVIAGNVDPTRPICEVMTPNPYTVTTQDIALNAISIMMQHNVQNVPIVDELNNPVGLITPSSFITKHRVQAIFLIEKITQAHSIDELVTLTPERQAIFEALVENKTASNAIGKVLAMIYDAYTRKLINLGTLLLGEPPCDFAWIVSGSLARNEVHFNSDQDSAIILPDGTTEAERQYFLHLAMYVCKGLDLCGFPLCEGRYMAATPKWCQPLEMWKKYHEKWVLNPEYDMLLNISVFLDLRIIDGNHQLLDNLNKIRVENIYRNTRLIKALTIHAIKRKPPLGIFNNLVLTKDGDNRKVLNIKDYAINILVNLVRIYSLKNEIFLLSTEERLHQLYLESHINERTYKDLLSTYQFLCYLRLQHQYQRVKNKEDAGSHISPSEFGSFERNNLRNAFSIISNFQEIAKMKFL